MLSSDGELDALVGRGAGSLENDMNEAGRRVEP